MFFVFPKEGAASPFSGVRLSAHGNEVQRSLRPPFAVHPDGEGADATHAGGGGGNQKKRWSIQARPLAVTIQPVVKEEDFWM